MPDSPKFVSEKLANLLPDWLIHCLWLMAADISPEQKGSRQAFVLTRTDTGQTIRLTQQTPYYETEVYLPCPDAVTAIVALVDDGRRLTMLLKDEEENRYKST